MKEFLEFLQKWHHVSDSAEIQREMCIKKSEGDSSASLSKVQFQFLKNCLKMMVSFPCGRISTCRVTHKDTLKQRLPPRHRKSSRSCTCVFIMGYFICWMKLSAICRATLFSSAFAPLPEIVTYTRSQCSSEAVKELSFMKLAY